MNNLWKGWDLEEGGVGQIWGVVLEAGEVWSFVVEGVCHGLSLPSSSK
jgi:hypothetical protein